jgi:hypothetical protein
VEAVVAGTDERNKKIMVRSVPSRLIS